MVRALQAISDSIRNIKSAAKAWERGRNMVITLYGIVEVIATLALIHRIRDKIGIPQSFTKLEDIIPAAIDELGLSKNVGRADVNTFFSHHQAARDIRDILLDIEVLDFENTDKLNTWLTLVEARFQGFRKAYFDITGSDLEKPEFRNEGTLRIEQQV